MRNAAIVAFTVLLASAVPARAELAVSMHDGRVTVKASDVTVRQILAEWAKVGQTKIVNAEGVAGGPITIQLTDVPEEQALEILLRSASGFLAAPRPVPVANASHFDRIIVMPTSAPSRATGPAPAPLPTRAPVLLDQDDDDLLRNGPPPPAPPLSQQRGFAPQAGGPQDGPPLAAPTPGPAPPPSISTGTSVPGMIIPAPQPGVPGQPQQQAR